MQAVAAKVEVAVLQPQFLRIVRLAEHRHGQFGGFGQHFDLAHADLDLAGGQVRVRRFGERATTSPSMRITLSARRRSATAKPGVSGDSTSWVRP